jgi:hypothetical protein
MFNMRTILQDFDWAETNIPLVIFIPNRYRGKYIRDTFNQFGGRDTKKCLIVIGNDGCDEDFSDLPGVKQFSIMREPNHERNGCFIRNYFIKRCRAKNIFQKDPETEIVPTAGFDWIDYCCKSTDNIVRPYYTMDIGNENDFQEINIGISHRIHWGFSAPTQLLQSLRGYDEDFKKYGYEDTDLYKRLLFCNGSIIASKDMVALHHPHPIEPSVYHEVNEMAQIYYRKDPNKCERNPNGWGEG